MPGGKGGDKEEACRTETKVPCSYSFIEQPVFLKLVVKNLVQFSIYYFDKFDENTLFKTLKHFLACFYSFLLTGGSDFIGV